MPLAFQQVDQDADDEEVVGIGEAPCGRLRPELAHLATVSSEPKAESNRTEPGAQSLS